MAQSGNKTSRNFDFKKPKENRFDFTKDEFDDNEIKGVGESTNGKGKTKWIAAALVGLLAVGGGSYYLYQQGDEQKSSVAEVVEPAKTADDTIVEATEANKEEQGLSEAKDETANKATSGVTEDESLTQPEQSQGDASPTNSGTSAPVADASVKSDLSTGGSVRQTNPVPATGAVEEEAREVIRGKYGNGDVRKRNLGSRYAEIQSKVNEMYRNGQVKN